MRMTPEDNEGVETDVHSHERMRQEFDRYLNPGVKARLLREFGHVRQKPIPAGDLSGRGYPDPGIVPFCDWLNSLDGVCTLQSCEGHRARKGHIASSGVLWIWFDKELSDLFRERASQLVVPPIERVAQVYSNSREFVEIIFGGNENGQLDLSLAVLGEFMASLLKERARRHSD
jgi:hypothetical protein